MVRWKGYGHKENSWLVEGDVNAPDLIAEFYRTHPNAPKHISSHWLSDKWDFNFVTGCGEKRDLAHWGCVP